MEYLHGTNTLNLNQIYLIIKPIASIFTEELRVDTIMCLKNH